MSNEDMAKELIKKSYNVAGDDGGIINSPNDQAVWLTQQAITYALLHLADTVRVAFSEEEPLEEEDLGFVDAIPSDVFDTDEDDFVIEAEPTRSRRGK
jgi:hypothetical protein